MSKCGYMVKGTPTIKERLELRAAVNYTDTLYPDTLAEIQRLERELAEANRRMCYLLRVSGLGRVEAVDECIRRDNAEEESRQRLARAGEPPKLEWADNSKEAEGGGR